MTLKKSPYFSYRLFPALLIMLVGLGLVAIKVNDVRAEKPPKVDELVEKAILAYGSRASIYQTQRTGILRSLVKFFTPQGTREGNSAVKFIRKLKLGEDLIMIELDMPGTKYTIGFDGKDTWSIHDGEIQTPSQQEIKSFRSAHEHSYEALLRYRENNSKLEYVGSNQLGTLVLDIADLVSPEGVRTRYEISRRSFRILYLSYEDKPDPNAEVSKYRLNFKDFRVIQNTLIPYETQVFQNGKLVEERKIVEAAFNVQLEEKAFKAENVLKPAESTPGR